ncbi:hypothetical protein [Streptomyces sp. NPDC000851]
MENLKAGLAWARAHKTAVLPAAVFLAGVAARFIPGLPVDHIVNAVSILLGA